MNAGLFVALNDCLELIDDKIDDDRDMFEIVDVLADDKIDDVSGDDDDWQSVARGLQFELGFSYFLLLFSWAFLLIAFIELDRSTFARRRVTCNYEK